MCDFKPGDEIVCVDASEQHAWASSHRFLTEGAVYVIDGFDGVGTVSGIPRVFLVGVDAGSPAEERASFHVTRFRKVERRNDSLSIEAFLTIKPGFEEPKRKAPAKKRERAS